MKMAGLSNKYMLGSSDASVLKFASLSSRDSFGWTVYLPRCNDHLHKMHTEKRKGQKSVGASEIKGRGVNETKQMPEEPHPR